jgi:hypothetical protein
VVPQLGDSVLAGLLLFAGAVVVSVWLGRQWRRAFGIRVATVLVNVVVISLALVHGIHDPYTREYHGPTVPCCGLISPNGTAVTEIRPYDSEGRPLTDVQLYDQYGNPLEVGGDRPLRFREDGTPAQNVYPIDPAPDGLEGEVLPGPVAPLLPRRSGSPSSPTP